MTDRHAGYLVTLDCDIREDDAEEILTALRMVRGVVSVKPVQGGYETQVAAERRDAAWTAALIELMRTGPGREGTRS